MLARASPGMGSVAAMSGISAPGIRILLFAGLRDRAGWSEQLCAIEPSAGNPLTPRQLWDDLQLPDDFDNVRIAINHQFASADTPLKAGDELAFLPPISGG